MRLGLGPMLPPRITQGSPGMRFLVLGCTVIGVLAATPMMASADDAAVTREEVERKKREVREMERELRRQEREAEEARRRPADEYADDRAERRRRLGVRAWAGIGAGVGWGAVDVTCQPGGFGDDCREEGVLHTYTGNVTVAGPAGALRLRGIRQADKGNDSRTPYETAALIGTRFGRSDWYGLAGYGRVRHPDDDFTGDKASGFAWEILFAPSSAGLTGLELSFQGNSGRDVDFVAFNIGLRIGALR
jgi:hypothetical protein